MPGQSSVQMLSLLPVVTKKDKVMKESDKVIEVEKKKLLKIEVILVLVEYDLLLPILDADSSMKTVHSAERHKSLITDLLTA